MRIAPPEIGRYVPAMSTQNVKIRFSIIAIVGMSLAMAFSTAACTKEEGKQVTKDEPAKKEPAKKDPAEKKPTTESPGGSHSEAPTLAAAAGDYQVDASHSSVIFRAKHFGASYTYGSFNNLGGTIKIDADPAKSEVSVEIDAASLFSGDKKRDDHLKGPDFLNVKQFPKVTFKSTAIKAAGAGKYEVTGNLSLHGVTKPVTAVFEHVGFGAHPMVQGANMTGFHSALTIKRSDFEVKHMLEGISDEIDLMISIEAIAKK